MIIQIITDTYYVYVHDNISQKYRSFYFLKVNLSAGHMALIILMSPCWASVSAIMFNGALSSVNMANLTRVVLTRSLTCYRMTRKTLQTDLTLMKLTIRPAMLTRQ